MKMNAQLGLALAEIGITATLAAEPERWREAALFELREFAARHGRFTLEQFRIWWLGKGYPPPHSHKVWGGLTRLAERDRIIAATGSYKRAASPKTHGHPVMIWRRA